MDTDEKPSLKGYLHNLKASFRPMMELDLRDGDWASALISMLAPHFQLYHSITAQQSKDEVSSKFQGIIEGLKFGPPPHGGCALGIDRMIMLLAEEENIREVIMFPMNQKGEDLMMNAPTSPTSEQLRELNLKVIEKDS